MRGRERKGPFSAELAFVTIWDLIRGQKMLSKDLKKEVWALRAQIKFLQEREKRYVKDSEMVQKMVINKEEEFYKHLRLVKGEKERLKVQIQRMEREMTENRNWKNERLEIKSRIDVLQSENDILRNKVMLMEPIEGDLEAKGKLPIFLTPHFLTELN